MTPEPRSAPEPLSVAEPPSADALRATLAALLEEEPADLRDDTDLIACGLDSIMLMRLVADWRRAGLDVTVAALAERPTLAAWARILGEAAPAPGPAPRPEPSAPAPAAAPAADGADRPLGSMQHAYWVGRTDGQYLGGVAAHLYTEFDGSGVE